MYIMGENPAMSDPDVQHAREALAKLDHLVVQDIFLTETAKYADVVLPASAWPEKDGTVSNTNRQVQMGRAAIPLPGQARRDLDILIDMAKGLGLDWNYSHVSEVFTEMTGAMPSLANITWERVEREESVTYPVDGPDVPGHDIVFNEGFPTVNGRGRFVPAQLVSPAEEPDTEYPMVLTTGRQLEHWHTGSMTRRSSVLDDLEPEAVAYVSARDMERLGTHTGNFIQVSTRRGSIRLKARIDGAIPPGLIFIPFAYAEAAANVLTNPQLDPFGKIPEFKYCAAKIEVAPERVLEAAE
jgi:formate dehydrogenase major subunit